MSKVIPTHDLYMLLAFRPMVCADGVQRSVGITMGSPQCYSLDTLPNLIQAAPALYQQLSIMQGTFKEASRVITDPGVKAAFEMNATAIQTVLDFALYGYASVATPKTGTLQ